MTGRIEGTRQLPPAVVEWLQRWLNVHRVLWILTLACFFIAWNRGLALLYGVFSLALALLLISHLMPRWQLRGLQIDRRQVGEMKAGEAGTLIYRLRSSGRRYHIVLNERLPFAGGEHRLFFTSSETNGRQQLSVECEQRGVYRLHDIEVSSAYPFGIVRYSRRIPTPPLEVVVLPRVYDLTQIPVPVIADANREGDVAVMQQGGHGQFAAVREYAHGDELRSIHWRASARLQQLVVKEYERIDCPVLLVVLDCRAEFVRGEGARTSFEMAISIAASMIHYASREGLQSVIVAEDQGWREMTIPAYSSDLYDLYELLARLESSGRQSGRQMTEQAIVRYPQANLVTGFRLDTDSDLPEVPANLTYVDIELDAESFIYPLRQRKVQGPGRDGNRFSYRVEAMTPVETLFQ